MPRTAPPPCEVIVHVGDSTTLSMLPYLQDDYSRAGWQEIVISAGNGRSIVKAREPDQQTGLDAIQSSRHKYQDKSLCWVIALGTNDSATNNPQEWQRRLDLLIDALDGDQAVIVNVYYDSPTRPEYAETDARDWNALLLKYEQQHLNLHVFHWALLAKMHPEWFLYDGLHYDNVGSMERSYWVTTISSLVLKKG